MKEFTLYWRTGNREVVKGNTPSEAMTLAGYGGGASRALDFYAFGDNYEYEWNKVDKKWKQVFSQEEPTK